MHRSAMATVAAAIVSFAVSAHALMMPLTIEELTLVSDTIISGTVTTIKPFWGPEKKTIYSMITIEVEEHLRADDDAALFYEFKIVGGTMDDLHLYCPEYPQFVPNEHVILFLSKDKATNLYHVPAGHRAKIKMQDLSPRQQKALRSRINKILKIINK